MGNFFDFWMEPWKQLHTSMLVCLNVCSYVNVIQQSIDCDSLFWVFFYLDYYIFFLFWKFKWSEYAIKLHKFDKPGNSDVALTLLIEKADRASQHCGVYCCCLRLWQRTVRIPPTDGAVYRLVDLDVWIDLNYTVCSLNPSCLICWTEKDKKLSKESRN